MKRKVILSPVKEEKYSEDVYELGEQIFEATFPISKPTEGDLKFLDKNEIAEMMYADGIYATLDFFLQNKLKPNMFKELVDALRLSQKQKIAEKVV